MRQVTGRSCKNSENKASIRLAMGGRFFSASLLENVADSGDVVVRLYTSKVALLPEDATKSITAEQALAMTGQAVTEEEIAVFSCAADKKCAAMAICRDAAAALSAALGERLKLTSPLLDTSHSTENCLTVEVADGVAYIRLYNSGLQFAEALTVDSADELLYYVSQIFSAESIATDIPIYIIGNREYSKLLKKYYRIYQERCV